MKPNSEAPTSLGRVTTRSQTKKQRQQEEQESMQRKREQERKQQEREQLRVIAKRNRERLQGNIRKISCGLDNIHTDVSDTRLLRVQRRSYDGWIAYLEGRMNQVIQTIREQSDVQAQQFVDWIKNSKDQSVLELITDPTGSISCIARQEGSWKKLADAYEKLDESDTTAVESDKYLPWNQLAARDDTSSRVVSSNVPEFWALFSGSKDFVQITSPNLSMRVKMLKDTMGEPSSVALILYDPDDEYSEAAFKVGKWLEKNSDLDAVWHEETCLIVIWNRKDTQPDRDMSWAKGQAALVAAMPDIRTAALSVRPPTSTTTVPLAGKIFFSAEDR